MMILEMVAKVFQTTGKKITFSENIISKIILEKKIKEYI